MPYKVEQICHSGIVVLDYDECMSDQDKYRVLGSCLGEALERIASGKYLYKSSGGKRIHLLLKQVTYLGHPHALFKKRIQIPCDWIEYARCHLNEEVHFIGLYKYKETVVFVDFETSGYLARNPNNSSAHIYTIDLYKALKEGAFSKIDGNGNVVTAVRGDMLCRYLAADIIPTDPSLDMMLATVQEFNESLPFGFWLESGFAYDEMIRDSSPDWAQAEWPGYWLESKMRKYCESECHVIEFRKDGKKKGALDFDLLFSYEEEFFFGDLKASDIAKGEAPGNDKSNFKSAIERYGRFWYLIYEHDTEKDADPFNATREYNELKLAHGKWPKGKKYDPFSYKSRMKKRVRFRRMRILELNASNYQHVFVDFNQGHQPDGALRAPKFMIKKKNMDAFCVHTYAPEVH